VERTRRGRWLILVVPSAIYFFSYFHRVAPAVVAGDLMRTFAITAAAPMAALANGVMASRATNSS
jgi:hypothetical protein